MSSLLDALGDGSVDLIQGYAIPLPMRVIATLLGNRDPAVHEDPDSFRIDRPSVDHVTFGLGNHFCMGATLTRTEARITLDAFLDRFATLDPGDEPPQRQNRSLMPFGFTSLPLVPRRG